MGNVGIIGRARVGKDTAGAWLVDNRGYRRIGFADPLKEAVSAVDPIVNAALWPDVDVIAFERLSDTIAECGAERAKDENPEVRRLYQEFGRAMRAVDPEIWIRPALAKVIEANEAGVPCVITDVRYPNEAESLRRAGFHLLYIHRPGVPQLDHESEGALTAEDADHLIINNESVSDLQRETALFADRVEHIESRRHYARL